MSPKRFFPIIPSASSSIPDTTAFNYQISQFYTHVITSTGHEYYMYTSNILCTCRHCNLLTGTVQCVYMYYLFL